MKKYDKCDSLEMSKFQRCGGFTIHGCGNPLYNVYDWGFHPRGPHCHAELRYDPVPCYGNHCHHDDLDSNEYLTKDEAGETYATNENIQKLVDGINLIYATKEYVDDAVSQIPGATNGIHSAEYDEQSGNIIFKDTDGVVISTIHIGTSGSVDAYTKAEADAKFVTTADTVDSGDDVDNVTPEIEEYVNNMLRNFGKTLAIVGTSLQLKNGLTVLSTVDLPKQESSTPVISFLTQEEYSHLDSIDNNTIYYITEN